MTGMERVVMPGHGPHRAEVVIGFEPHAARRRQCRRRRQIAGPAFEDDGTAMAPCIGPHMRSQAIGGPACRMVWPSPSAGMA